jgi:hypothetical protein
MMNSKNDQGRIIMSVRKSFVPALWSLHIASAIVGVGGVLLLAWEAANGKLDGLSLINVVTVVFMGYMTHDTRRHIEYSKIMDKLFDRCEELQAKVEYLRDKKSDTIEKFGIDSPQFKAYSLNLVNEVNVYGKAVLELAKTAGFTEWKKRRKEVKK